MQSFPVRLLDVSSGPEPLHFVVSLLTALFAATGIAIFYGLIEGDGLFDGLFTGLSAAILFTILPITNNHKWADRKFKLTLIDAGHYLVGFSIAGAIYGLIA